MFRYRTASPAIAQTVAAIVVPLHCRNKGEKIARKLEKNYSLVRQQKNYVSPD